MRWLDKLIGRYIANKLLRAPNGGRVDARDLLPCPPLFDEAFHYTGHNGDILAAWVMQPRAWRVSVERERVSGERLERITDQYQAPRQMNGDAPWVVIEASDEPVTDRNRTILLLHGWWDSVLGRPYLRSLATQFASAGYRVVMPDLRGHGLSQGRFLSYGLLDRYDIKHLIDELAERGWVGDGVGVFGHSYGGNVALMTAAEDERIRAVVSASAPHSLRGVLPASVDRVKPQIARWVSMAALDRAIERANRKTGLNYYDSSAEEAITKTTAPVLLIHGERDTTVPFESSQRIIRSRPEGTETLFWPDEAHASFFTSRMDELRDRSLSFFDQH
ncbi:alpha/beta fold hydrolase [bacterium]|nr:alpha/beta fold hydrolase [bacterium]